MTPTIGTASRTTRRALLVRAVVLALLSGLFALGAASSARASSETLVNETFTGSTTSSPNWVLPTTPSGATNQACLTAGTTGGTPIPGCSTATDTPGSGALRFTTPATTQEGGVDYGLSVPTTDGLDATFDTYQYGPHGTYNRGADGISFFFAAADPTDPGPPATIGQPGGDLGYSALSTRPGLSDGYLGIGLDVYGNYANTSFEGTGCTDPAWDSATQFPDNVSVRGPGDGTTGYCMLNSTEASGGLSSGTLDGGTSGTRSTSQVPVEVVFNPSGSTVYTASGLSVPAGDYEVAFTPIGGSQQILSGPLPNLNASNPGIPSSWINPSTGVPYQLTFGWTGSTGGDVEYHELNALGVGTANGIPAALTVGVSDDASGYPTQNSTMNYDVTVANQSGSDSDPGPINVTDTVPGGETPSSTGLGTNGWSCSISGQQVSCSYPGPLAGGADLPQLVIPVTVNASPGTNMTNTVVASSDYSDPGSGQDTATVEPAPSNLSAPSIYGKTQDGQLLSAAPGSWSYAPTSYSYQWYVCPAADAGTTVPTSSCSSILGATDSTYTLTPSDVGNTVEVAVEATNPDGTSPDALQATGVVTPGPAATVSVTLGSPAITANGSSWTTATALVTDAWGVPVPGDAVAFSSSGGQTVGSTSDNGDGTYQATITSTTASGAAKITAVDDSMAVHPSGSATLTQDPGPAAQVALSLFPASITADGGTSSTATAMVTDAYGNPVTDPAADIAITAGGVGGGAAPSVGPVSQGSQPGTYVATITSTTQAGSSSITAEDTLTNVSESATLTQTPGRAADVTVSLSHPSVTADGDSQTQATVTVTDLNGNPITGDDVQLTSTGGQSIGSVSPGPGPGTYVATITSSTTAGASTITATDTTPGSQNPSGSTTLTQVAGPAAHVSFALSPASIVAGGVSTSQAMATVTDAHGNPVSGDAVSIASNGGQSVSPVSPGPNPGTYVATITSTGSVGTSTITAVDTSASPNLSVTQQLTQVPGAGDRVDVTLSPASITANGTSTTLATATVTDENGNPVSGNQVAFTSSGHQTIGPVSPGSAPGTYQATITSTTTAGTSMITAANTSLSDAPGDATLIQTAGAPAYVTVSLSPSSIMADGQSTTQATIKVTDLHGNPVSGDPVKLVSSGGQQIGAVTPTGAPGTYSAMILATNTAGQSTITASDGRVSGSTTLTQTNPGLVAEESMPSIQIDTPAPGGIYLLHKKLRAAYFCTDPLGVTGIVSCAGPNNVGRPIDTNVLGTHAFTVTAVNRVGEIVRLKAHYLVVSNLPSPRPLAYLSGALSLRQGSVFVPVGCLSPTGLCSGKITLRMTMIGHSASGQVTYRYVKVGFHRYKLRARHRWVFRIPLSALGRQSFPPGAPLPTIILGVKQLRGPPQNMVIN